MTGTLQQINALAHRWHRDMEQLANGHNGERKLMDDADAAEAELDALWEQHRATVFTTTYKAAEEPYMRHPLKSEGYFNDPVYNDCAVAKQRGLRVIRHGRPL